MSLPIEYIEAMLHRATAEYHEALACVRAGTLGNAMSFRMSRDYWANAYRRAIIN